MKKQIQKNNDYSLFIELDKITEVSGGVRMKITSTIASSRFPNDEYNKAEMFFTDAEFAELKKLIAEYNP